MSLFSGSLYRLFWIMLLLVTLLPTLMVTFLLVDRVVAQSQEHALKGLSHRVELQSELLERELSLQLNSLLQLSRVSDVQLTPTSAIFGYQAGVHLKNYIQNSPKKSAAYILDREHWQMEVYPLSAELIQLDVITAKIEPFLEDVTLTQEVKPLIFTVKDPSIVSVLNSAESFDDVQTQSDWVFVMVVPLIQKQQHAKTKFKVVGSLVFLEAVEFLDPLLAKWQPIGGGISIFEGGHQLYSSVMPPKEEGALVSIDSSIELADKVFTLQSFEPLKTLQAIVFDDVWQISFLVAAVFVIVALIGFFVTRLVKLQLRKLTSQVQAFALGDYQFRVEDLRFSEFLQVSSVLELLSKKVITDQVQLEELVAVRTKALQQVNGELNSTLEALQDTQDKLIQSEKMASLGQLVAGIAHELNTPLGICVTAIGLVEEVSKSLDEMVSTGVIKKSTLVSQLSTLVDATSLVSRNVRRSSDLVVMFKELSLDSEVDGTSQFELLPFLQQLSNVWLGMHQNKGISSQVFGDDLLVEANMGTLRKVLSLLFDNALEHAFYSNSGGEIKLSCHRVKGGVEIDFCDNGTGVTMEPISRIFEPFYTSNRSKGSVGLGLHLAYNLVTQRLNGDIVAKNREDGGLQLTIRLPRAL